MISRCLYCHSAVASGEENCYMCGYAVPKRKNVEVSRKPVSFWTNLVFLAAIGFTNYCFFAEHKLSLPVTAAISCGLIVMRLVAERL